MNKPIIILSATAAWQNHQCDQKQCLIRRQLLTVERPEMTQNKIVLSGQQTQKAAACADCGVARGHGAWIHVGVTMAISKRLS